MTMLFKQWKKWGLYFSVFITGAAVLIIEILALRILAPYFGNTLFSASSTISVILTALSLGYYVGGKMADRRPEKWIFFSIILAGGVAVLFSLFLSATLLRAVGYALPITYGPFLMVLAIFFLPAFLLALLSPFAVKIQSTLEDPDHVGSISGYVFFWSTLGSILGSLATGFLLIPFISIPNILTGVGILLISLGALPLFFLRKEKRIDISFLAIGAIALTPFIHSVPSFSDTVYSTQGRYAEIVIHDGLKNGRPVRYLNLDRSSSGAMYLDTGRSAFPYTKYWKAATLFHPSLDNVLVLGGGAYMIPKTILETHPETQVTVSEIEPLLYPLSQKYFALPESPRLSNTNIGGRRFLVESDSNFDLIFTDVYFSLYSIPVQFTTIEFFKLAKAHLTQNGVFIGNFIGTLSTDKPSLIFSLMKTFRAVFPNSYFFADNSPASDAPQNIIFVGISGDKTLGEVKRDLPQKKKEEKKALVKLLENHRINIEQYDLKKYTLMSDSYAPANYMSASVLLDTDFYPG